MPCSVVIVNVEFLLKKWAANLIRTYTLADANNPTSQSIRSLGNKPTESVKLKDNQSHRSSIEARSWGMSNHWTVVMMDTVWKS